MSLPRCSEHSLRHPCGVAMPAERTAPAMIRRSIRPSPPAAAVDQCPLACPCFRMTWSSDAFPECNGEAAHAGMRPAVAPLHSGCSWGDATPSRMFNGGIALNLARCAHLARCGTLRGVNHEGSAISPTRPTRGWSTSRSTRRCACTPGRRQHRNRRNPCRWRAASRACGTLARSCGRRPLRALPICA